MFVDNINEDKSKTCNDKMENRNQFASADGRYIYHVGIIDYLQDYNWEKFGETKFKSIGKGTKAKLISSVPPPDYARRFFNFMQNDVIIDQFGYD